MCIFAYIIYIYICIYLYIYIHTHTEVDDETWKPLALASLMKTRQPSQVAVCDGTTHTNALPDGAAVAVAGSSAGVHSTHIFQSALDVRADEVATHRLGQGEEGGRRRGTSEC